MQQIAAIDLLANEVKALREIVGQFSEKYPMIVQTKIHTLPDEQYKLRMPVDVMLKIYPDEVLALIPELELYGEGSNEMESLSDLKSELIDLFEDLSDMPDNELGNVPKGWKRTLNQIIQKCR